MSAGPDRIASLVEAVEQQWSVIAAEADALGDLERARALQFFEAAMSLSLEMWFEKGDPTDPHLTSWEHPWRKFGGDNPGTVYLTAPVRPGLRYLISGRCPGARYVGVQAYTKGPGYNAPAANLSDEHLGIGPDGTFELEVGEPGSAAPGRPLLPISGADYLVMVRCYMAGVDGPHPDLSIRRVDDDDATGPDVDQRWEAAVGFLREAVLSTVSVTDVLRAAGANAYPGPDAEVHQPRHTGALFPTRDNAYDGCWVHLAPGETLVVQGTLPAARYTSFVFYDRWFTTPDQRRHRCFLTGDELTLDTDGTYTVHLGPEDTGHPNWIDTAGLRQGILALRALLPTARSLPRLHVVPTATASQAP
jgi:hypothetical protein